MKAEFASHAEYLNALVSTYRCVAAVFLVFAPLPGSCRCSKRVSLLEILVLCNALEVGKSV
jgi:hypothetical protein